MLSLSDTGILKSRVMGAFSIVPLLASCTLKSRVPTIVRGFQYSLPLQKADHWPQLSSTTAGSRLFISIQKLQWVFYYFAQRFVFFGILFLVLTYPFKIPKSLFGYQNPVSIKKSYMGYWNSLLQFTIGYREPQEKYCVNPWWGVRGRNWVSLGHKPANHMGLFSSSGSAAYSPSSNWQHFVSLSQYVPFTEIDYMMTEIPQNGQIGMLVAKKLLQNFVPRRPQVSIFASSAKVLYFSNSSILEYYVQLLFWHIFSLSFHWFKKIDYMMTENHQKDQMSILTVKTILLLQNFVPRPHTFHSLDGSWLPRICNWRTLDRSRGLNCNVELKPRLV